MANPLLNPQAKIPNLVIRPVLPRDARDLYAIVSHPEVARTLIQMPSMELSETLAYVQRNNPSQHRLIAEVDERVIGQCVLTQFQRPRIQHTGRIGMMVHPDYWGQGVGGALLAALLEIADNWLDLKRVELDVFIHNVAAIRLYEKFGFATEGSRRYAAFGGGRWFTEVAMARLRNTAGLRTQSPPSYTLPPRQRVSNLDIRPPRPEDIPSLHDLYRHPAVSRTTLQMPSQEISRTEQRINHTDRRLHRYVAVGDGNVVGNITLYQNNNVREAHKADLGMMVHPAYWGQGIGSKLMETVLELADDWLNLKRVELEVNTDNPAGVNLYQKFGFKVEGTKRFHTYGDGRWTDSHFMARIHGK